MSISKINNSFYFSNTNKQLLKSGLPAFKGTKESTDDLDNKKYSDEELYSMALAKPAKRFDQIAKNTALTLLVSVPIVDSVMSGLAKYGKLSSKLGKSFVTAGKWGAVFASGIAVAGIKNTVNSTFDTPDKFDKKHGFLSSVIDFAAIYTGYNLLNNTVKKVSEYTKNSFPNSVKNFQKSIIIPIRSFINNSFINKKIVKPAEQAIAKKPSLFVARNLMASLCLPVMVVAAFMRYQKEADSFKNNVT